MRKLEHGVHCVSGTPGRVNDMCQRQVGWGAVAWGGKRWVGQLPMLLPSSPHHVRPQFLTHHESSPHPPPSPTPHHQHSRPQKLRTRQIKMLILDEADEMLNLNFQEQIYNCYRCVSCRGSQVCMRLLPPCMGLSPCLGCVCRPPSGLISHQTCIHPPTPPPSPPRYLPPDCQVVVVSATLPVEVLQITQQFMTDPIRILVKRDELTLEVGSWRAACCLLGWLGLWGLGWMWLEFRPHLQTPFHPPC
jgi:hypothetical protein